jgi:hypothetical protein
VVSSAVKCWCVRRTKGKKGGNAWSCRSLSAAFSVRVDSVGSSCSGDLIVAAASFLQAGTVVAASAHECDVFVCVESGVSEMRFRLLGMNDSVVAWLGTKRTMRDSERAL